MGRPRIDPTIDDGKTRTFTIALPRTLVESIDEFARVLTRERLDNRVTRAAAVRDLLVEGLARWRASREATPGEEAAPAAPTRPARATRRKPARTAAGKEGRTRKSARG